MLMREIKEYIKRLRELLYSWFGKFQNTICPKFELQIQNQRTCIANLKTDSKKDRIIKTWLLVQWMNRSKDRKNSRNRPTQTVN